MSDHSLKVCVKALFLNLLMTFVLCLSAIPVQSQDEKEPRKSPDGEDVIRVSSNLVNLDVMVKDKKGKAVTDLKAEDFVLSENGVRQNIEFFDSTLAGGSDSGQPATPSVSTVPRFQDL